MCSNRLDKPVYRSLQYWSIGAARSRSSGCCGDHGAVRQRIDSEAGEVVSRHASARRAFLPRAKNWVCWAHGRYGHRGVAHIQKGLAFVGERSGTVSVPGAWARFGILAPPAGWPRWGFGGGSA